MVECNCLADRNSASLSHGLWHEIQRFSCWTRQQALLMLKVRALFSPLSTMPLVAVRR
ncbi:hypothetical protein COOONC_27530 [Cooperia oncophora]